jgi:hypothetical protein
VRLLAYPRKPRSRPLVVHSIRGCVGSTGDNLVNSLVNFVGSAEWRTVVAKCHFMPRAGASYPRLSTCARRRLEEHAPDRPDLFSSSKCKRWPHGSRRPCGAWCRFEWLGLFGGTLISGGQVSAKPDCCRRNGAFEACLDKPKRLETVGQVCR